MWYTTLIGQLHNDSTTKPLRQLKFRGGRRAVLKRRRRIWYATVAGNGISFSWGVEKRVRREREREPAGPAKANLHGQRVTSGRIRLLFDAREESESPCLEKRSFFHRSFFLRSDIIIARVWDAISFPLDQQKSFFLSPHTLQLHDFLWWFFSDCCWTFYCDYSYEYNNVVAGDFYKWHWSA